MAAAAIPVHVAVNNYALPAAVLDGLLTKYEFTSTRFAVEPQIFSWQEKDPQFRYLPVICSGYSEVNDGTVYVNGEILSLLSEQPVIEYDCAKETFDTVMTFVHSMHRGNRTLTQLLELLPLVRQCKLPLLFDSLALCIVYTTGVPLHEAFAIGLETESLLLVEYCFQPLQSAVQLCYMMRGNASILSARPKSAFVTEVLTRVGELMAIIPELVERDAPEDPRRVAFNENYWTIYWSTFQKLAGYTPNLTKAAPIWDIHLTTDDNLDTFASREILAHASRFFRQTLYGGFLWNEECRVPRLDIVYRGDFARLIALSLPTFFGFLWRVTASAPESELEQKVRTTKCQVVYEYMFSSEPEGLLRSLKLAEHLQIPGLVNYLVDVAVHCLPWRERLRFADALKSCEIMASLLSEKSLEEICASDDRLEGISQATKDLLIEYFARTC